MDHKPHVLKSDIRQDPFVVNLFERIPQEHHDSFSDEQLTQLKVALGSRTWGQHKLDWRGTIKLFRWRYYYVFIAGRNRRQLSRREKRISRLIQASLIAAFICFSAMLGLLLLYLLKSAAGIDLIPGHSFGVWDWFKQTF